MKLINNRYKVNRLVNENTYNSIYDVIDLWDNDRKLFLKLYNTENNNLIIEHFIKNYLTYSRIKHRNLLANKQFSIARVIDGKKVEVKQYYSTSEFIDVSSIDKLYTNLSLKDKLHIILQICSVLDFLHYSGLVYKHLSPTNIFLTEGNIVKLRDIATVHENFINASYDNITRFFIAPEVIFQQDEKIDQNADKYSLGKLFIYLLTDNLFQTNVINYDYRDLKEMDEYQISFLDQVINNLTNRNPALRDIKLLELIDNIKKIFSIDYSYNLVEERGILNFKTKIVGRDRELKNILEIDEDFINHRNYKKLVLINGDRGIGKTRFLNEISFLLNMKGRYIYNIEITSNSNFELMPITNILRQTIKDTPRKIHDKYAREFVEILPELKFKINNNGNFESNGTINRLRLYDRITNYFEDFTKYKEAPIYLIIDNIGEASVEFLFLLDYLIQNISYGNLMVIASLNQKIIPKDSTKLGIFNRWLKEDYTETILLSSLGLNEIGELIQNILGINYKPLNFSAVMLRESKGNPKVIEYMMKDLYAKGELFFHKDGFWEVKAQKYTDIYFPSSLDEAIKNQIGIIERDYMDVMNIISCYESSISKDILSNMVQLDKDELDLKLQDLTTMRLVDEMVSDWGYSYSINNIELKKLIYYRIPKEERIGIHKKIANYLEEKYKENLDIIIEELIYHLVGSNQREKAIKLIIKKAKDEKIRFGPRALYLWEEAYEIAKDMETDLKIEVLEALGMIYFRRGDYEKAIDIYEKLYEESIKVKNHKYCAIAQLGLGEIYYQKNLIKMARKKMIEGFKVSEEIDFKHGIAKSKILYCRILLNMNRLEELEKKLEEVSEYSCSHGLKDMEGEIYNIKGLIEYFRGNLEKSIEYYNKSVKAFHESGQFINSTKPMNNIANIYSDRGDYHKAMEYYEKALDIVDKAGILYFKLTFLNNIGEIYMDVGKYDKAKAYIEEARNIAYEIEDTSGKFITSINLSLIYLNSQDYYNSYKLYVELKKEFSYYQNFSMDILSQYFHFLGEFYTAFGKWDEAREWTKKTIDICKEYNELYYLIAESRLAFIDFYNKGKYDKKTFENIRSKFKFTDFGLFKRKFLIELAGIAFVKDDYDYVLDILKEDGELKEENPFPVYDNMRKILLNSFKNIEEDSMDLVKLGEELNSENLILVKIFNNIIIGNKAYENDNYYSAFNHISEAIDLIYKIVKNIPDKEYQISFIEKFKVDNINIMLVNIIENIFGETLELTESDTLYRIDNIDDYFDYSSLIEVMNESQFTKLVENNILYRDVKDINDIPTLMKSLKNDYKHNLKIILKFLCKETLAQRGYILMYNEENNKFAPVVALGGDLHFKPNHNLLSLANRYENGILLSTSLGSNVVGLYKEFLPKGTKALMCIPIRIGEIEESVEVEKRKKGYDNYQSLYQKNIGFIYLETDRLFNRFDEKRHILAEALKNLLYINMDNYRLKTLSTIDKLTGTYTRKYFEIEINKIINESRCEQKSFGLMIVDLDNFKLVNDTYGHRVGDEVLSKVGNYIRKNLRKTDIVARYGGEEFIIILKNVMEEQALKIGEKIREGIANLYIPIINNNITISIGLSMFPNHSQFKEELIIKADQALYIAKDKGKNRIEVWNPNLTDTLKRVDRLAGILSGNINIDQRNLLAILDVLNIAKSVDKKEDIIFEFLGRVIETIEAENCSLIEIDKDMNISRIYSRSRLNQKWISNPYINSEIVKRIIDSKKGEFLIDWDSSYEKESVFKTPNWQSVMAIPLILNNKIKAVGYMTVPIKEKEFDYNSYNLAKILWDIFAFSF